MLGPLGEGQRGTRWTLLESGSWVSPSSWHSMCGVKRLVCVPISADSDETAAGESSAPAARKWLEQRQERGLFAFDEKRREVFCTLKSQSAEGQDKVWVYRLADQQLQRAVSSHQLRLLNLQTPAVLDALRWATVEAGSWQVQQQKVLWAAKVPGGHSFEPLDAKSQLARQHRLLMVNLQSGVGVKRAREGDTASANSVKKGALRETACQAARARSEKSRSHKKRKPTGQGLARPSGCSHLNLLVKH